MSQQEDLLSLVTQEERAGFRLHRLELFNWGTFDGKVWALEPHGDTSLLTGDIGSGKSTLVDALTTLLVPPQKLTYNKAAGAEARERTVRSYFFGHYKAERGDSGGSAKPISLRDHDSYSVLLAHFFNEGYQQHVTLAQVFFMREQEGQPTRIFLVADERLGIAEHFSRFADLNELRRRLRTITKEVHDSFPPYLAAFRRRFGIGNDQALELFNQTISMKSVGNLTEFVRQHMLQPFPVQERIGQLIGHFDDLNRVHEAVLQAKDQLALLTPLVEDCDRHEEVTEKIAAETAIRNALEAWFGKKKVELLTEAVEKKSREFEDTDRELQDARQNVQQLGVRRDELKQDIARNGGERITNLEREIRELKTERDRRQERAAAFDRDLKIAELPHVESGESFAATKRLADARLRSSEDEAAAHRQTQIDRGVELKDLTEQREDISAELDVLRRRRSNIPAEYQRIRGELCAELGVEEDELPFAGELMQVRPEEQDWEGAIERVLRGFGISLLVPNEHYEVVSQWVDRRHLGLRLVYHRVHAGRHREITPEPRALVRKLQFKHASPLSEWVEKEVARSFNFICCDTLDEFRREREALTKSGQQKSGQRHIKDDRRRIDDRRNYVLGWSNEEKRKALEAELGKIEREAQTCGDAIADAQRAEKELSARLDALKAILRWDRFEDLDWRASAVNLERLQKELVALQASSDMLRNLEKSLAEVEEEIARWEVRRDKAGQRHGSVEEALRRLQEELSQIEGMLAAASSDTIACFPRVAELAAEAGVGEITRQNANARERDLRVWLQARIDADSSRRARLRDKIVSAMEQYRSKYPMETREADASLEAAHEYRQMLERIREDDLPRFEQKFKELLNENTIREIANFQAQLGRERHLIEERIEIINRSLHGTEFNRGRYIKLVVENATDAEVRDFRTDLKACTDGTLSGSEDTYSEAKFLQVKQIIERFRGREGSTELDERWTRKVTDVRNWFSFSASERWLEDDREHEFYTDSGGKSGGQKEKLAYTVLAASLAYQFGLEWGERRSRSFRFVVIDEAFGRGSDESASYGLELFQRLNLQLLVVTPLQKLHVIEPYVAHVGFVSNPEGERSTLSNFTIEEYQAEKARLSG